MTLLVTIFAAVFVTIKWYTRKDDDMKLEMLIFMYWGATLMWMIDAVFEFVELKAEFFSPAPMDMLNDAFLGLSVIALGLVVWMIRLLITDPKGVIRKSLTDNK
ncbi:MAG: hypothetical protein J6M65_04815 [Eubacterium sp.]|nr:hypothetical protein [Eubacterium sp.]